MHRLSVLSVTCDPLSLRFCCLNKPQKMEFDKYKLLLMTVDCWWLLTTFEYNWMLLTAADDSYWLLLTAVDCSKIQKLQHLVDITNFGRQYWLLLYLWGPGLSFPKIHRYWYRQASLTSIMTKPTPEKATASKSIEICKICIAYSS